MYAFPEPGPGPRLVRGPSPSHPRAAVYHSVPHAHAWGHPDIPIPPSHPLNICKQLRLCHPLANNVICPQQMVQKPWKRSGPSGQEISQCQVPGAETRGDKLRAPGGHILLVPRVPRLVGSDVVSGGMEGAL